MKKWGFFGKKAISYNFSVFVVFLALFAFAFFTVWTSDNVNNTIKDKLSVEGVNHPIALGLFVKTLDELTPMVEYKLPLTDSKIFGINKLPSFGLSHSIFISLLMLFASFIMNRTKVNPFIFLLVILLMIPLGYFIMNFINYFAFLQSASTLGITSAEAKLFLSEFSNSFDNVLLPVFIISLFAVLSLGKIIFKTTRNRQR